MLNPDTRVAVVGYSGDQKQIEQSLDLYLHHGMIHSVKNSIASKALLAAYKRKS
jgi:hypothetical protein